MSSSTMLHGPFTADARLIQPTEFVQDPFVSLDIRTPGASITLVSITAEGLEAISAALGEARVLLAEISPAESLARIDGR